MTLDQNKLDAKYKQRSNTFNWKGQFTPEFVEYLIDSYFSDGGVLADPFSGSGTVFYEAVKKNMSCVGFEVNPSAYYMSKFYEYSMSSTSEKEDIFNRFKKQVGWEIMRIPENLPLYTPSDDYRTSYKNLLAYTRLFISMLDTELYPLLINILFLSEKDKKMPLRNSLIKNTKYVKDIFFSLPFVKKNVSVHLGDARCIDDYYQNAIDMVITSPPYINVINYHQNYRGIIECLGYDILKVAECEIGSNRKHRSNRFKTVVQYSMDMGHTILNTSKALKLGGKLLFVVGKESMVRKTPFYNSQIIKDIINAIPSLQIMNVNERKFDNRYGECIREDIIYAIKKNNDNDSIDFTIFENIGLKHIEHALAYASPDLKEDLQKILNKKETIVESPIY